MAKFSLIFFPYLPFLSPLPLFHPKNEWNWEELSVWCVVNGLQLSDFHFPDNHCGREIFPEWVQWYPSSYILLWHPFYQEVGSMCPVFEFETAYD